MLKIAQISDIHCGTARFDSKVLKYFINEINKQKPDLLVVAGDLTCMGYKEQFEEAKKYLDQIKCKNRIVIAGNHDCQNVGDEHFESIFGPRYSDISFCKSTSGIEEAVHVMAVDSNRPDIGEGEVGRDKYKYMEAFFRGKDGIKILTLHHHLISIPGTGRERNVVYDAGDILQKIDDLDIDIVLSGHKHVPYVWHLNHVMLISSGTAGTWRTRGNILPSINIVEIDKKNIRVSILYSNKTREVRDFLHPRRVHLPKVKPYFVTK